MSELMHVNVIVMLSPQVSRQQPHFHPYEWHIYQGRAIQQRRKRFIIARWRSDYGPDSPFWRKPDSSRVWKLPSNPRGRCVLKKDAPVKPDSVPRFFVFFGGLLLLLYLHCRNVACEINESNYYQIYLAKIAFSNN